MPLTENDAFWACERTLFPGTAVEARSGAERGTQKVPRLMFRPRSLLISIMNLHELTWYIGISISDKAAFNRTSLSGMLTLYTLLDARGRSREGNEQLESFRHIVSL